MHYADSADVAFNALKVATLMTLPVDPESESAPKQRAVLAAVRHAFVREPAALGALITLAGPPLARHPRMTERDAQTVQLVLTFVRQLLQVNGEAGARGGLPAEGAGEDPAASEEMRARLLERLGEESVLELVAMVAQHAHENPFKGDAPLILAIVHDVLQVPSCPRWHLD